MMKILKNKNEILKDVIPWESIHDLTYYLDNPLFKDHKEEGLYSDFMYPFREAVGTLHKHVRIYKLIDEFVVLSQDYNKCESGISRGMIEDRLKEIIEELQSFIIFDMKQPLRDQRKY